MPLRTSTIADRLRRFTARLFLVALRRATHRMPARLRSVVRARVLVVAPHFDDEAIPCGGTLVLHARAGSAVHVAFMSDSAGPRGDANARARLATLRRAEADAAKQVLGYASDEIYDFPDDQLVRHEPAMRDRLVSTIRAFKPEQIFCPFPSDGHGDHQATALAVGHAAVIAGFDGEIWAYEVWNPLWPNAGVDIAAVAADKERAIRCHASQVADRDYAAAILGLNRYRGMPYRVALAEAYYICSAKEYRRLVALLDYLPAIARSVFAVTAASMTVDLSA